MKRTIVALATAAALLATTGATADAAPKQRPKPVCLTKPGASLLACPGKHAHRHPAASGDAQLAKTPSTPGTRTPYVR